MLAVRRLLVVMLLVLAGSLGVTASESSAPGPLPSSEQHHVMAVDDMVMAATGDHSGHGAEAIGLLCLCAMLVTGIILATHRSAIYRISPRPPVSPGLHRARATALVHAISHDPVLWGVSRT